MTVMAPTHPDIDPTAIPPMGPGGRCRYALYLVSVDAHRCIYIANHTGWHKTSTGVEF
jgi:hypothetical protein